MSATCIWWRGSASTVSVFSIWNRPGGHGDVASRAPAAKSDQIGDHFVHLLDGGPVDKVRRRAPVTRRLSTRRLDVEGPNQHNLVEHFNKIGWLMSTVNFSVPEKVKQVFNEAFQGQNKSAVIADLMLEAVERARSKQNSQDAYLRILARRKGAPAATQAEFRVARETGRP